MASNDENHFIHAAESWRSGKTLEAGRLIFENLHAHDRPKWAGGLLRLAVDVTGVKSEPVNRVIHIADHPSEWKDAHAAFSSVRTLVLKLDRLKKQSPEEIRLHRVAHLAELVAKVLYNSTNPPDEFDQDSGWYVAVCVKYICDLLQDAESSRKMTSSLFSDNSPSFQEQA